MKLISLYSFLFAPPLTFAYFKYNDSPSLPLHNKNILITGENSPNLNSAVLKFKELGANVIIAGHTNQQIRSVKYYDLNINSLKSVKQFLEVFKQENQKLDILINDGQFNDDK